MKKGEEREIFIHPELSYGFEALKSLSHVKAIVKFLGNYSSDSLSKESLVNEMYSDDNNLASTCEDFTFLYDDDYEQSIKDNYCFLLFHEGEILRKVLLQDAKLDLQKLSFRLAELKKGEDNLGSSTPMEKSLSNQLFWNIYFNSKSKMDNHYEPGTKRL